jgi:hypothetical protein
MSSGMLAGDVEGILSPGDGALHILDSLVSLSHLQRCDYHLNITPYITFTDSFLHCTGVLHLASYTGSAYCFPHGVWGWDGYLLIELVFLLKKFTLHDDTYDSHSLSSNLEPATRQLDIAAGWLVGLTGRIHWAGDWLPLFSPGTLRFDDYFYLRHQDLFHWGD